MAEQMEPAGPRESWSYGDRPPSAHGRDESARQLPVQPFVTASESFGSFGPAPEDTPTASTPLSPIPQAGSGAISPVVPPPLAATPYPGAVPGPGNILPPQSAAAAYPVPGAMPPLPTAAAYPVPGAAPLQPGSVPYPYAAVPVQQSYVYPAGVPGVPGLVKLKQKKPIRFPLTRKASALLQIFGMLLYGLVMIICIMGCAATLLREYVNNASVYFYTNGNVNGLSVLITCVLILVIAPACSIFCGTLFGSWRGLLVSIFAISGGLFVSHLTDARIIGASTDTQTYLIYASLPLAALIVGLIYDNRVYATWWKSMLTMFLGVAIPTIAYAVLTYTKDASDASIGAALAHTTEQSFLTSIGIFLGCASLIIIPLLGLLYAGAEGLLHTIIARIFPVHQHLVSASTHAN